MFVHTIFQCEKGQNAVALKESILPESSLDSKLGVPNPTVDTTLMEVTT